jgi:phosphate/sulfate permease
VQALGQDDVLAWVLIPCLGFTFAGCALTAIIYGLTDRAKWNARFNPEADAESTAGATRWLTIFAVAAALMIGTAVLMASIAFSFQRYFEYQIEEGRRISQ